MLQGIGYGMCYRASCRVCYRAQTWRPQWGTGDPSGTHGDINGDPWRHMGTWGIPMGHEDLNGTHGDMETQQDMGTSMGHGGPQRDTKTPMGFMGHQWEMEDPNGTWGTAVGHGDINGTPTGYVGACKNSMGRGDISGTQWVVENPKEAHGITRVTRGQTEEDRPPRGGGDRAPLAARFRPPLSARFRPQLAAHFRFPPWAQLGGSGGWWLW